MAEADTYKIIKIHELTKSILKDKERLDEIYKMKKAFLGKNQSLTLCIDEYKILLDSTNKDFVYGFLDKCIDLVTHRIEENISKLNDISSKF